MDPIRLLLAFAEGAALIVSPCILPILPIVLSASVTGGRRRPFGIIVGFIMAFCLFTIFSRWITTTLGLDPEALQIASYTLLLIFGLVLLSDTLSNLFERLTSGLAGMGQKVTQANSSEGFFSGILVGAAIGLVWTPCSGPILAAVLIQAIQQKTNLGSALVLLCFSIGAGIPMLLIATGGRKMLAILDIFKRRSGLLRKAAGVIIILSVLVTGRDLIFQRFSSDAGYSKPLPAAQSQNNTQLIGALAHPYPAPEIQGIKAWINSPPLTIKQLKGKVVLIDFWTYSCINCIRTLPTVTHWYDTYKDKGLVVIGVHTPEFEFEKNIDNIKNAVKVHNIHYPVAADNDFQTWQNYNNQYWPAHYLIDKSGRVVYTHFGEGEDDVTENNIRYLLGLGASRQKTGSNPTDVMQDYRQTPETYLGYERANRNHSVEPIQNDKAANYSFPKTLDLHDWALSGKWIVHGQNIVAAEKGAGLRLHFRAHKVYLVLGPGKANKPIPVYLTYNHKPLGNNGGKDTQNSQAVVGRYTLYELLNLKNGDEGILDLQASQPGLEAFAFTFGS